MITALPAESPPKLAGLGLAAKVGTGIAAATIATAGVVTVAPVVNPGAPPHPGPGSAFPLPRPTSA
jgi:hypothetical protein